MSNRTTAPLGPIDPLEVKTIAFDFVPDLAGAAVLQVVLECTAASGTDAAAPTRLLGLPVLTADAVIQRIGTCSTGVTYMLRCIVTDSAGLVHVQTAVLPCARL